MAKAGVNYAQANSVKSASSRPAQRPIIGRYAAVYGKDSNQYEMAGGARKSEIKRSPHKKATAK